jgi:hypothetical protein
MLDMFWFWHFEDPHLVLDSVEHSFEAFSFATAVRRTLSQRFDPSSFTTALNSPGT